MRPLLAALSASIAELKKNPSTLLEQADGETVVILSRNQPPSLILYPQHNTRT